MRTQEEADAECLEQLVRYCICTDDDMHSAARPIHDAITRALRHMQRQIDALRTAAPSSRAVDDEVMARSLAACEEDARRARPKPPERRGLLWWLAGDTGPK